jgi:glycosyltransferase involved in cell wall biosynthesis
MLPPFSVLMSVYNREKASNLKAALESVADQTLPPNEIVVVKDGPLTSELDEVLDDFSHRFPNLKIVALDRNVGLGPALNAGLAAVSHDIVARMDSDDISLRHRFELQTSLLANSPSLSLVGSAVAEFIDDPAVLTCVRQVATDHGAILKAFSRVSPVNHPSVVYQRNAVLACGGYSSEFAQEDYHLWAKMLAAGYRFQNLEEPLVLMRTGEGLYNRRGGLAYARSEARLQREFLRMGMISPLRFAFNVAGRYVVRALPVAIRKQIYVKLLRRAST